MSLSVIGSGFGRTGTTTLKLALEHLGFGPTHHMEEVLKDPPQVERWRAVAAGQHDWNTVFAGFNSQIDWPGAHWWRELAAAYPNAKVIHSVRSEDSWWNSFSNTIAKIVAGYRQAPMPPHVRDMMEIADTSFMKETFGGNFMDKDTAIAAYRKRQADVVAGIPPERLLVFNVAEGWGPLCRFLGVAVPERPFPKANATEEFWQAVRGERPMSAEG